MNSPRRPMTAANGYSLLEPADCARATQRRIIAISDDSESCLVMALKLSRHGRPLRWLRDLPLSQIIMTGHGIHHIEKVPLIAQRLGKLSANIAAYWTTVRLGPMSEMGLVSRVLPVHTAVRNCTRDEGGPFEVGNQVLVLSHRKLLSSKAMVVNVAETPGQDSGRQG